MAELDEPLSDREIDVLELLAEGATNKEIAAKLFISPNTVKVHLRNINTKLGTRSRTEASRIALERGIVKIQGMELVEQSEETPLEAEPVAEPEPEVLEAISQPEPSPVLQNLPDKTEKQTTTNLPQVYLIGGAIIVLVLLAVIAWFAFSRPNATMIAELESTPTPFEPNELGDRWFASQMLPESLSAASAVAVGTDIYLIGGRQADGAINDELHAYDTVAHLWSTATAPPEALFNSAAVSIEQQIFVIGGHTADDQESDTVSVYSPTEDSWQFAANLPQALSNGLALSNDSQLYYLGGQAGGVAVANVYLFDRAANSWSTLPDIPEPRSGATGGIVSGKLYVIGGKNGDGEATSSCFQLDLALDPTEEVWSSCASMGNTRAEAAGTVILDKIYIIGGDTGADFGELYNPDSDLWEKIEQPMLEDLDSPSWADAGIARVESKVYLLGGEFNGTLSRDAFFYWPLVYQSFIPSASSTDN